MQLLWMHLFFTIDFESKLAVDREEAHIIVDNFTLR